MDDQEIIGLYWARSEAALSATADKYGRYCYGIAYAVLADRGDSEECVNDTYLRAWEAIPPRRPQRLGTFLGKLTRNLALDRYRYKHRERRGGGQLPLALEELGDCVSGADYGQQLPDELTLAEALNRFLGELPSRTRRIFLRRYWYFSSIQEIAADFALGESRVKMTLLRTRQKLRDYLEKEGIEL